MTNGETATGGGLAALERDARSAYIAHSNCGCALTAAWVASHPGEKPPGYTNWCWDNATDWAGEHYGIGPVAAGLVANGFDGMTANITDCEKETEAYQLGLRLRREYLRPAAGKEGES